MIKLKKIIKKCNIDYDLLIFNNINQYYSSITPLLLFAINDIGFMMMN